MTRRRHPKISEREFRKFKEACLQAKAAERRQPDASPVIYRDAERGGQLYLVPKRPDGWQARQEIHMTEAAKVDPLTLARDLTPGELGIPAENSPPDASGRARAGQRESEIEHRPDALQGILGDADGGAGIMEASKGKIGS
jgi:hypothetical protein